MAESNDQRVLRELLGLIDRFGWAVRSVFAVTNEQVDFAYTIGLTAMQHPEVVITGMPEEHAHTFLDLIGEDVQNGKRYVDGSVTDALTEPGAPVVFIQVEDDDGLTAVDQVYGRVDALQMVWPDSAGRLPWEAGYRNGAHDQPLLGPVGHVVGRREDGREA